MKLIFVMLLAVFAQQSPVGNATQTLPPESASATRDSGVNGGVIDRVVEATTEEKNINIARRILIEKATEKVSEEIIKEIIGSSKFERNRSLINSKVIKNSFRYIPLSRPGEISPLEVGYKMSVKLRISQKDLQKVLLENGLFYESDSTPIIMPFVRFSDRVNSKNLQWWASGEQKGMEDLRRLSLDLENDLYHSLFKNHFYMIRPQALRYSEIISSTLKEKSESKDLISTEQWQNFLQSLNVQILIDGDVTFTKGKGDQFQLQVRLDALMVQNGRSIAQVVRSFDTDAGPFERVAYKKLKEVIDPIAQDLASQVLDAWQKGTIGSSLYRMTLSGSLPIHKQEAFKDAVKLNYREIKEIKERLIGADQIVYEIDSSISPKEILSKAQALHFEDYQLEFISADERQLSVRLIQKEKDKK